MPTSETSPETLARQARQLETLDRLAQRFGRSLTSAMSGGASSGRELSGALDGLAATLSGQLGGVLQSTLATALQSAARGITAGLGIGGFGGGALPFGRGGILSGGRATPFAAGGIVSAPTFFPMAKGMGLMGERGAEAVMPLTRGPDGRLGVAAGGRGPANVTVNIAAQDVDSFRRSEAQVAAALARAVARGRRAS